MFCFVFHLVLTFGFHFCYRKFTSTFLKCKHQYILNVSLWACGNTPHRSMFRENVLNSSFSQQWVIAVCRTRLKIWWLFSSDYWVCGQWVCVVEVTACSFVVCLKWWVTDDKIVLSVLNMFTYRIVEGNWESFTPNSKGKWRGHAVMFLHMTVGFQSLSCISQPSWSTLL